MKVLSHSFRLYVESTCFEAAIAFHQRLEGEVQVHRIAIPAAKIDVAVVGRFIVLSGSEAALAPLRHVQAVITVESLEDAETWLRAQGAEILTGIVAAASGRHLMAKHPGGFVAEYFEALRPRASPSQQAR